MKQKKVQNSSSGAERFIISKDLSLVVDGYIDESSVFINNHGYIHDNMIWIYSAEGKVLKDPKGYPYFWVNDVGEFEFTEPREEVREIFNIKNIEKFNYDDISSNIKGNEELYDESIIDINSSTGKFCPTIRDKDDFLKKLIKLIIIEKGIDINRLKSAFKGNKTTYQLPNMRSALSGVTKTSTRYFNLWSELLGFDFVIIAYDNKRDSIDPMKNPIIYTSSDNEVNKLTDEMVDEIISLLEIE